MRMVNNLLLLLVKFAVGNLFSWQRESWVDLKNEWSKNRPGADPVSKQTKQRIQNLFSNHEIVYCQFIILFIVICYCNNIL